MEKYGVDVTDTTKVSEDLTVIPRCGACGSRLESSSNVPKCPRCGTKPFESPTTIRKP